MQLGLSNAEVARRLGMSERRYAHYVTGDREPDLATLVRISEVLLASPNALLGIAPLAGHTDSNAPMLKRILDVGGRMPIAELELFAVQMGSG